MSVQLVCRVSWGLRVARVWLARVYEGIVKRRARKEPPRLLCLFSSGSVGGRARL